MKNKQVTRKPVAMAILTTLATLTLLTVLLLALLSTGRTELASANVYADNLEVRGFSEAATNLVIGQIRDATGRINEAWASQPGAIRRWDQSGNFVAGHKLYSDSDLVATGSELEFSQDLPDSDWENLPARFVDLNEPAVRSLPDGSVRTHFPIIDPRAAFPEGGGSYGDPGSVEGFGIDATGTSGIVLSGDHSARLPMPVEWLYILEDGTVGYLDDSNTFVPSDVATAENPIVGRVAFWADDETAKININTASEPTFWDLPRSVAGSVNASGTEPLSEDVWYAKYQPGQNEWQRYPGHPATTALSSVLFPGVLTPENKESIYEMVPRIIGGGSKSGTFWDQRISIFNINPALDRDRLFASVDEFTLSPNRTSNSYVEAARLERSDFFLTSSSRASELNLFGLPKICMWPIDSRKRSESAHVGEYWLSPYDSLFEFVSTTGWIDSNNNQKIDFNEPRNSYIYQRVNPNTVSDEWKEPRNVQLWNYLAALTSVAAPGYGGNFKDKYNTSTSTIPGSEGNDRDNLITATFDYIRITNGLDPFRQAAGKSDFIDGRGQVHPLTKDIGSPTETRGFGRQYSISSVALAFICNVDPIFWPDSNQPNHIGFTEIKGYENLPAIDHDENPGTPDVKALPKDRIAIQAAMLIDTGVAMQGWRRSSEDWLHARVAGLHNLKVWGYSDANPGTAPNWVPLFEYDAQLIDIRDGGGYHGRNWGGNIGLRPWMAANGGTGPGGNFRPRPPVNGDRNSRGRLRSNIVLIPVDPANPMESKIRFQGGDIEIDVFRAVGDGNFTYTRTGPSHVHTFFMNWPSFGSAATDGFPRPYLAQGSPDSNWSNGNGNYQSPQNWWHWDPRIDRIGTIPSYPWGDPPPWMRPVGTKMSGAGFVPSGGINAMHLTPGYSTGVPAKGNNIDGYYTPLDGGILRYGDVVRSLVLTDPTGAAGGFHPGDLRLVSGRRVIPKELFKPHAGYFTDQRIDHILNHCAAGPHYMLGWSNNVPVDQFQIPTVNAAVVSTQLTDARYHFAKMPTYPRGIAAGPGAVSLSQHIATGDFDNGVALTQDGAYCNKPDDGNARRHTGIGYNDNPIDKDISYLSVNWDDTAPEAALFSPNRQIPSPVMFGSLPTGVKRGLPWQTLLFRPQKSHPNHSTTSPDHLWLDLFWMPVVEPYALSEPHSTAGKINLNTQIVPFGYIQRNTGIISLLKSEEMLCVPDAMAADYKNWDHACPDYDIPRLPTGLRRKIELKETLKQWDVKHRVQGKLFRSPGEICDIHLVPDMTNGTGTPVPYTGAIAGSVSYPQPKASSTSNSQIDSEMAAFWEAHSPTGDNSRERPYAHIYPRLTTRSNSYRVHIRAQVIRQARSTPPDQIDPTRDSVFSEYRGSTLVERYIDPTEPGIPDYATIIANNPDSLREQSLDVFYRFRIVNSKRFDP